MTAAFIEIKPGRYFVGIWFIGNGEQDCMAAIWRDPGERCYHLDYRFRYYAGPDVWDGKDERRLFLPDVSEEKAEQRGHEFADVVSIAFEALVAGKVRYLSLHSDNAASNIEKLAAQPWSHMRHLTEEEAVEGGYVDRGDIKKETVN